MGPELFDAIITANPGGLTEDQARNATRSLLLGLKQYEPTAEHFVDPH